MTTDNPGRPGAIARLRSRQSGLPTGLLGRFFGRAMESATAPANNRALAALDLSEPRTVLTPAWMDPDVYRIRSTAEIMRMLRAAGFARVEHTINAPNDDDHVFVAHLAPDP